jgi:hypothetical protein
MVNTKKTSLLKEVISPNQSKDWRGRAPRSKDQAPSFKRQASSFKLQAPSSSSIKRQASSPRLQASSFKPQAASSLIREPRYMDIEELLEEQGPRAFTKCVLIMACVEGNLMGAKTN